MNMSGVHMYKHVHVYISNAQVLGQGNNMIVIHCCDRWSTTVIMIVLF